MFNESQKFVIQIVSVMVIVFLLALILAMEFWAALLWALVLGLAIGLLMRANRRVAGGTDLFRDILDDEQMWQAGRMMKEKLSRSGSNDDSDDRASSQAAPAAVASGTGASQADARRDATDTDDDTSPLDDAAPTDAAPQPMEKPKTLDAPRDGEPDDLTRISGIGPKLRDLLHSHGYYHFDQIAAWSQAELNWIDDQLEGFKGRASRDNWVSQAQELSRSDS